MTEKQAGEVAAHLSPRTVDDRWSELAWTIRATLFDQFGDDEVDLRLADQEPKFAQWLSGKHLFTVTADVSDGGSPKVHVSSEPLSDKWSVELTCLSAKIGPMQHPGLRTHWVFRSPSQTLTEIYGEVDIPDSSEKGRPDSEEKFARLIAAQLDWT
jgi:hypothetical protein